MRVSQLLILFFFSWAFSFQDMQKHWAKEKVESLVKIGAIKGYDIDGDGQGDVFKPNGNVTRAEFMAILARALGWPEPKKIEPLYADVREKAWHAPWIQNATFVGIIPAQMIKNKKIMPNQPATRAEIAFLVTALFENAEEKALSFKDLQPSYWAYQAVSKAVAKSIVEGYPDRTFKPDKSVTRAEASVMVIRTLAQLTSLDRDRLYNKLTSHLIEKDLLGGYTGLIVNCLGFDLQRSQNPLLLDEDGSIIYPAPELALKLAEVALETGAVSYYASQEEAHQRTGRKPLVIACRGTKRAPGVKEGKPTCPVLSQEDAKKILKEAKKTGFLEHYRVAILTGSSH